mmetsp:Transcript_4306/g.7548  ORF Transcript_4306/g.7548 Transcript_4306/m.7548 type:complete len:90 (+) Transcript_4306:24-293(+)
MLQFAAQWADFCSLFLHVGGRPIGGQLIGDRPIGGRPMGGQLIGKRPIGGLQCAIKEGFLEHSEGETCYNSLLSGQIFALYFSMWEGGL